MPRIKVKALKGSWVRRATKPGAYTDGFGLTLRIGARGNKRWVHRITINRRQRNMGLGSWPRVSLVEARRMALGNWRVAKEGRDPIAEERAEVNARMQGLPTFEL